MFSRREALIAGGAATVAPSILSAQSRSGPVGADWNSLAAAYEVPDWFRDAKFGIWAHWGPQCQPEFGDWYGRLMYVQGRMPWIQGQTPYEHHLRRYGHPSRSGFLDIIGDWKAENWQPEYLMRRYKQAGARYFMAMGCHHDNLDLFASRHHEWNSARVGPKRDILGTWAPLAREAGLKFGISNHSGHAWHWWQVAYGYDAEGPYRGRRYDAYWLRKCHGRGRFWDGLDPQELYTGPYYVPPAGIRSAAAMSAWHDKRDGEWHEGVPAGNTRFVDKWLLRQKQLVEDYRPDIIYLDHYGVPFGRTGLEAIAHYYNRALEWRGDIDVVITSTRLGDFEQSAMVWNVERGFLDGIHKRPWQTATCIGNWHYDRPLYERNGYKSAKEVVQRLADVVSKNGNLLLSIPVRGDGSIDDKEEQIIDQIASWTALNGEAIFGTRPWRTYGEGPTRPQTGDKAEHEAKPFTPEDIRFTAKDGKLYAIFLDWPDNDPSIAALGFRATGHAKVERVSHVGGAALEFAQRENALAVTLPKPGRDVFAPVICIEGHGIA